MRIKKQLIIGQRPENIPADWLIFNAPRPLVGAEHWQGDFHHGIFYAAVRPGECAKGYIAANIDLDAYLTEYISEDIAHTLGITHALENDFDPNDFDRGTLIRAGMERYGITEVEI